MERFEQPEDLNVDAIISEMSTGKGFVIVSGLFTEEEIRSAKDTVMYLISKEGRKATHFQVSLQ